ncbi:hypothetical protein Tco_0405953, partial [Tanacetum coccineum]
QSARLIPPDPVPSPEKADDMILQDMIQVSLAEHKSSEEQEAREMWHWHDDTFILGTSLEPRSDKESPKVKIV